MISRATILRVMVVQWAAVGGLSAPSKMPSWSYSLPARMCRIGGQLRQHTGTVCSMCYALKGRYLFNNVQAALLRRWVALNSDLQGWFSNMDTLLGFLESRGEKYFRWHDSGDVASAAHLHCIVRLAQRHPGIQFWLPTREYKLVRSIAYHVPSNLTIRVSAPMVGGKRPNGFECTSTVANGTGYACPAAKQDGKCKACRACWNRHVANVDYHRH